MRLSSSTHHALPSLCFAFVIALTLNPLVAATEDETADDRIRATVERAVRADPDVPSRRIGVTVVNGIVLLSGMTDNILSIERAVRQAETILGVRSVIGDIRLDPTVERSDTDLIGDIYAALRADRATVAHEIQPWVDDGIVTLGGTVDSWQEKFLVEEVVKGVPGVREVDNVIEVVQVPVRSDDEILAEIEKALRLNTLVDATTIHVKVRNGQVRLQGAVGSATERRRVVSEAWTSGARAVHWEGLKIDESSRDTARRIPENASLSDENIREVVEDALLLDPRVSSVQIEVDVRNGIVTLQGQVGSDRERRAAGGDARHTAGVHLVQNRLLVEKPGADVGSGTSTEKQMVSHYDRSSQ